ncbi:MAG TPA: phytoene/squalene synthase family protein [Caulobacteraceae bacterium]|nr:phytoene/squalene synthase family protein [Caulobacteraceae bacterium]
MTDALVAHSRESITKGSKSFRAASRLFDANTREDAWLLYSWCRRCDDEIDGQDHGLGEIELTDEERAERLERLYGMTRAALRGEPTTDPVFAAFQRVALKHALPEEYPLALLDGFAMDVAGRRYRTLEDTLEYCWHVAGVVGVMMAYVMGVRDEAALRRAQDLGIAFQLTNIARDVVEDAQKGRVYLPQDWLTQAGAEAGEVASPSKREAVFAVTRRLLETAEPYYDSAKAGLRSLPFRSSMAIAAARGVYREIGRKILRRGPGALDRRAVVGRAMKLWLFGRGALIAVWTQTLDRGKPASARPELWTRI